MGSTSRTSSSSRSLSGGRGSSLCRPTISTQTTQSRPTSNPNSFGATKRPSIKLPTKKAGSKSTVSSSKPSSTVSNSDDSSIRGAMRSTTRKTLPKKTTTKRFTPPKKRRTTTVSSASLAEEESSSDSSTKTSAKKYLQNLKSKLQSAATWFVENKDKTLDEILVERWKEKCVGAASKKEKRKRCVSAALAEREEDTEDERLVKNALKSLLEEDSDEVYEFLSRSSSKTFRDIENEGDLGTETAVGCRRQKGNGRTKRSGLCRPSVTQNFRARHVMGTGVFEYYRINPNNNEFQEHLQNYRKNWGQNHAAINTIIKNDDLDRLPTVSTYDAATDIWTTNQRLEIIQVDHGNPTIVERRVRFKTNGYGEIVHMEPPLAA